MMNNPIKLNLARNCLRYIIRAYNISELFMPFYICPTVINAARKEHCRLKFYHIDKNFYPIGNFDKNAFILYPNYFGICAANVRKLENIYPNFIVDNAHNPYMKPCGLASFNSLRKFFKVKDGAELYISKTIVQNFPKDKFEYEDFSADYDTLRENEIRLNDEDIKLISECTIKRLTNINREEIKAQRLKKFNELHNKYKATNELKFELTTEDIPFVYPYLIRDEITGEKLEKEGYLILRYWNNLSKNMPEYDYYKYLIPIPLL